MKSINYDNFINIKISELLTIADVVWYMAQDEKEIRNIVFDFLEAYNQLEEDFNGSNISN